MILINPKTELLIQAFINRPHSSVILVGAQSTGVPEHTQYICAQLLAHNERHNVLTVSIEKPNNSITVEQIRDLKKLLTTSIHSKHPVSRIIILQDFHTATIEAQNALLKVLEEPTEGTIMIIQAQHTDSILSTIMSRVQNIPILPLQKVQAREYAALHENINNFEKYYLLSQGEAKLFESLIQGTSSNLIDSVDQAKTFLGLTPFERLQQQKQYEKSEPLQELIINLERIASVGLHTVNEKARQKWASILHELRTCSDMLNKNVIVKLIFIRLCISL